GGRLRLPRHPAPGPDAAGPGPPRRRHRPPLRAGRPRAPGAPRHAGGGAGRGHAGQTPRQAPKSRPGEQPRQALRPGRGSEGEPVLTPMRARPWMLPLSLLTLVAAAAHAANPPSAPALEEAKQHADNGLALYKEARYPEA